jgi:hypothetical protein
MTELNMIQAFVFCFFFKSNANYQYRGITAILLPLPLSLPHFLKKITAVPTPRVFFSKYRLQHWSLPPFFEKVGYRFSFLRFVAMAGHRYALLSFVFDRIFINVNPEGIDRGLQCVKEHSKTNIRLPLGADAYFLFKDGYFDQTDHLLIKWDSVYLEWTAEKRREIRLWLVQYF